MRKPKDDPVSLRKAPQQDRSAALVKAVLEAAVQVLAQEGASRFTMARVAEKAGASVGSLYQYFPNKASILFRLQCEEWQQTDRMLHGILEDRRRPPPERLRALVHAFLRSECEEAAVRGALQDAAPLYKDAPEAKQAEKAGVRFVQTFLREALPTASSAKRRLAGELLTVVLGQVGRQVSQTPRTAARIAAYADATADMFCAYLRSIERRRTGTR